MEELDLRQLELIELVFVAQWILMMESRYMSMTPFKNITD